jgi:hypothetical protein
MFRYFSFVPCFFSFPDQLPQVIIGGTMTN